MTSSDQCNALNQDIVEHFLRLIARPRLHVREQSAILGQHFIEGTKREQKLHALLVRLEAPEHCPHEDERKI